jgi:hypothetical protein
MKKGSQKRLPFDIHVTHSALLLRAQNRVPITFKNPTPNTGGRVAAPAPRVSTA